MGRPLFLSLSRPSPQQQKSCLAAAGGFNYDTSLHGASSTPKSPTTLTVEAAESSDKALVERGFSVNRSRVLIGSGTDTFLHAKSALLSWKHLALGWANVDPDTPVKAGTRFCICYKEVIPWVMFPLHIAYVTDDNDSSVNRKHFHGAAPCKAICWQGRRGSRCSWTRRSRCGTRVLLLQAGARPVGAVLPLRAAQAEAFRKGKRGIAALLRHVAGCSRSQ